MKGTTNARKELEQLSLNENVFSNLRRNGGIHRRGGWKGFSKRSVAVNSSQIRKEDRNGWLRSGKIKRTRCCRSGDRRFLYRSELLIEEVEEGGEID